MQWLYTINKVQQYDRPTSTQAQGETRVLWLLSSQLVSRWECVVPRGDTPLCRPSATGSRSAHVQESWARLGHTGAVRGPHLEWQGFLRMPSTPQMTRERGVAASLERVTWNPDQDMI